MKLLKVLQILKVNGHNQERESVGPKSTWLKMVEIKISKMGLSLGHVYLAAR